MPRKKSKLAEVPTTRMDIRMPVEVHRHLKIIAAARDMSVQGLILALLESYTKRELPKVVGALKQSNTGE